MLRRRTFKAVVLFVVSLGFFSASAWGQEHPTADQLFQQGMQQYSQGQYAGARETFRRVDPMQLPKEQRVTLYETMQDIDRRLQQSSDPGQMLKQAEEAQKAGQLPRAVALYKAVAQHPQASEGQKQTANARLAESQRRLNADLTRARQSIDEATTDIQAGRLDQADKKLQAVQASGIELGWFDTQRLQQQLALIKERRAELGKLAAAAETKAEPAPAPAPAAPAAPAPAPAPAAAPAPATPAPAAAAAPAPAPAAAAAPAPALAPAAEQYQPESQIAEQPKPQPAADDVLAQARRLYAQERLAQGRQAEQAGQYHLAAEHYRQAVALDPDNQQAVASLTGVQAKVAQDQGPRSLIDTEVNTMNLRSAAAVAEFNDLMNRSGELLRARNFSAAMEAAQNAKVVLDRNQRVLPTAQYQSLREQAVNLTARIADEQRLAQETQTRQVEVQRTREAEERRQQALREQHEEVQRLLRRARDLQKEQRYDQSLELLNQALFLDPNNVAAQAMKDIIEDARIFVNARENLRRRALKVAQHAAENLEATIPYTELMTFPADWPQITSTRLRDLEQGAGESEVNRRVSLKLREAVPINFEANKLVNVLDYMKNTTGLNFFINWPALEAAGVEQDRPISLQLQNVPAEQALRLVLRQAQTDELNPIGFSIVEGVVTVSTQRDLTRTTDTRVYDIRDLLVQVPNFENAPNFDLGEALGEGAGGGGGGGGGGGSSLFGDSDSDDEEEAEEDRTQRIEEITTLIQDTVGRQEEWQAYGGDVSSLRELNGNLIVRTTTDNHREILGLLGKLRETRAMQIAVEARFLLVDQNFLEEVGVDLDIQYTPGGNWGPIGIGQDTFGMTNRPSTGIAGGFPSNVVASPPGTFTPGSGFPASGRSLDIGVSYLDDLQVNLLIRATHADRRSISLTAPRLTLFNGQRAYVTVARQVAFISDLEPVPEAAGFDPEIDYVSSGVKLDVEATISADRRYVTMTVRPDLATLITPMRTSTIRGTSEIGTGGGDGEVPVAIIEGTIELPEVEITQVRTTVSVPDRGTLLLGGQRLLGEIEVEAGVPVLSKIPILNRLFTNRSSAKDERTLLILIKPTIILQSEEEEKNFPGILQNPTEYGVGRAPVRP